MKLFKKLILPLIGGLTMFSLPAVAAACNETKKDDIKVDNTSTNNVSTTNTENSSTTTQNENQADSKVVDIEKSKVLANKLNEIVTAYKTGVQAKFGAEYEIAMGAPTAEEAAEIVKLIDEALAKIQEVDIYTAKNIDPNLIAWYDGVKYNLEIEKGNYGSDIRYLLPSYAWGPASSYIANPFYRTIMLRSVVGSDKRAQAIVAQRWLKTIQDAVAKGVVPSKVFIKTNANIILKNQYSAELKEFLDAADTQTATIDQFFEKFVTPKEEAIADATEKEAVKHINAFYKYYLTTYYKASKYGFGENATDLTLSKTNSTNELERILTVQNKEIYGVGLTKKDMDQKNAGLGYIPTFGPAIYAQTLKMATSSDWSAQTVYEKGYDSTKSNIDNTIASAQRIATLITGNANSEWKETIRFDADGPGPDQAQSIEIVIRDASGNIDKTNFFKWLNSEDFFFGREEKSLWTDEFVANLKKQPGAQNGIEELKKFGYDFLITPEEKDKAYKGITNGQFYDGALSAFVAYYQFKDSTTNYGNSFFEYPAPNYEIQTYNYADREYEGVGAYSSNVQKFMFNADPYYSLQKWSVTSFANHESIMGHHNQIYYAIDHKASVGDVKLSDKVDFDFTSYIEGWALFMEWFGIEAGYYGTPDYANANLYAMPTNFKFAKGITSFYTEEESKATAVSAEDIESIKSLHNGIYWQKVNTKNIYTDDASRARAAIELCNILQFIGALNEAQLRNMRLAIDTAYNGGNVRGKAGLDGGASINEVREFMKTNSALGAGDIASESIRYFTCVGQATSYNSGKEIFIDLYKKVYTKLNQSRPEFIAKNNHENTKKFFDIVLRNGALPMGSVEKIVNYIYDIK
ncbi:DUF885 family protein [Mycoplasmopsis felifaucium]|uniref:DUF885 family protein n=1 Tax=Mycoplasmopsis felifaucium TaxID=35768 RepID=UPI0012EB161A|nr:DUF885 family protein [Mycoplasmopsis felifaucium]